MSKYGEGLGIELVKAVNKGELLEPVTTKKIREYCEVKNWKPSNSYINVYLANTAAENHSPTYKKYFEKVADGEYAVTKEYR
ncbi:hypothetical protein [[Clostridium] fimetarium]|uniref:Uncharacterized protein n=1 Tax=[Clostridium] fimetarium TaxID=99656 RepID=A0A1I0QUX5_9FIRM|nr:hypothetical protein [[Clostridium] fimetarium]SEW31459.1 hypothetical protein SAMN05421659_109150 [[Clostridium] fimetarium]